MPRKTPLPTGEPLNDWRVVPAEKRRLVLEALRRMVHGSVNAARARRENTSVLTHVALACAGHENGDRLRARAEHEDRAADGEEDNARAFHRALEALKALADDCGAEEADASRATVLMSRGGA